MVNQEATIKKFSRKDGRIELLPANVELHPLVVTPSDEFEILGVVIGVIRYCQ